MGGILAQILNGVGRAAGGAVDPAAGSRMREQLQGEQYQGHQNDLNRWITQHAGAQQHIDAVAARHPEAEDEIRAAQLALDAAKPGDDLGPHIKNISGIAAKYAKLKADKAAADAATIKTPPPIPAVTQGFPGTSSNPLAASIAPAPKMTANGTPDRLPPGFQVPHPNPQTPQEAHNNLMALDAAQKAERGQGIAGAIAQSQPSVPTAAQPATSPVSPAAQGGAPAAGATFPGLASSTQPSVPTGATPPGTSQPSPGANGPTVPQPIQPLGPQLPEIYRDALDVYHRTGFIPSALDSLLPEMGKHALGLMNAQEKLRLIEPYLATMDPQMANFMRMQVLSGGNGMIPGLIGAMEPNAEPNIAAAGIPKSEWERLGIPEDTDPNAPYRIEKSKLNPNHIVTARPMSVQQQFKPNDQGGIVAVNPRTLQQSKPIEGLVAPGSNNLVDEGVDASGHKKLQRRGDILKDLREGQVFTGAGVNPAFIPAQRTSTTSIPGQLPTTTTSRSQKGAGGAIPPIGSGSSSSSGGSTTNSDIIKKKYDSWATGGPAPTGRDLTAVQAYQSKHNLPDPITLSATGQKNLQQVDAVQREIDEILPMLAKLPKGTTLATNYALYKQGFSTPMDSLFTKLSFEGLRSAAAALQGNNSRAYPVIQSAFQHVPNLDRFHGLNPDAVKLIKDKLEAMKGVIEKTRETVLHDERKSGVILPLSPSPQQIMTGKQKSTGNPVHSLDGGKTWLPGPPPVQ